jgi:hypothetical protein
VTAVSDHVEAIMGETDSGCGCDDAGSELRTVDFSTFVLSLGTSALYQLGQGAPEGGEKPVVNLAMARHVIDLIAMLQQKTRGNLSEDETGLVETLLFDLRLKFVEVCRRQSQTVEP